MPGNHATGTAGVLGSSELNRDTAGLQGTFGWAVQSGAVTFSTGLTFNVAAIATADYKVAGVNGASYAGGTVTLAAQDATNPRVDIIVVTVAGAVSAVAGTPVALTSTGGPVPLAPTAAQLEIARIYVPATGGLLSASSITDRRVSLPDGAVTLTTTGDVMYASAARTPARLGIGTAGQTLQVSGGIPAWVTVAAAESAFDSIRTSFRSTRRLVGEYNPSGPNNSSTFGPVGFEYYNQAGAGNEIQSSVSGENVQKFSVTTAQGNGGIYSNSGYATIRPSMSPRMLCRVLQPAVSANVIWFAAGFFSGIAATTSNGALLRITTTGNVFFVTRQGASETTTDLGVLSRTVVLGYEIESTDAGVTWVCRNQAGTTLATHTTNVPTAATSLFYGVGGGTSTAAVPFGVAYIRVEATIA